MKRSAFALIVLLAGCSKELPTAPAPATEPIPLAAPLLPEVIHHNIPASMADGSIVWVCSTQPRTYLTPDGKTSVIRDHYIAANECPTEPIE